MDPVTLLHTIFGAVAGKTPMDRLWLLAVAVVIWWVWREGFFRPLRRRYRK